MFRAVTAHTGHQQRRHCLFDRRAVFVGPGETGIAPEIHTGDDDALKEILTHVTEATKKQH
ncbi:DNA-binding protein [Escherichia coli]